MDSARLEAPAARKPAHLAGVSRVRRFVSSVGTGGPAPGPCGPLFRQTPLAVPFLPFPAWRVERVPAVAWPVLLASLAGVGRLTGQAVELELAAQAIPSWTRQDPVPGGEALSEFRLAQPLALARLQAMGGHLELVGTLDLEGWTAADGELTLGAWGEGFNDRRHPHTYVHELMLSGVDLLGGRDGRGRLSLGAGKGFVPFGSDDPMARPAFKYPVNHHLSQILERAVVIAGYRAGPALIEAALFNGDEPERPGQWPLIRQAAGWRFGDSWAGRLTLIPLAGLELSFSRARVKSPEHRQGAGTDQRKWHAAARGERRIGGSRLYLLAEWARTTEADGFFEFTSLLGEGEWRWRSHRAWYRWERTDRPEDQRTLDPFRSVRPHLENSILGTSRWRIHTLGYGVRLRPRGGDLLLEPFGELSIGAVERRGGGLFDPARFYGRTAFTSVSLGARLAWRLDGHRMGHYGGLLEPGGPAARHRH